MLLLLAGAHAGPLDRYAEPVVAPPSDEDPFRWELEALALPAGETGKLRLRLVVPPGTVVYRDVLEVVGAAAELEVGAPDLPPGIERVDPITGVTRELYDLDVLIDVPVTADPDATGLLPLALTVRHQGCRDRVCYPPVTTELRALIRVTGPTDPSEASPAPGEEPPSGEEPTAGDEPPADR